VVFLCIDHFINYLRYQRSRRMIYIKKVIDSLLPPVEPSDADLVPTKVQVVVDRTQCSPLTSLLLRKLASTPDCLIYDKSQLRVKTPRGLSSTHASTWVETRVKKRGAKENHLTTLVLYCPKGHSVPVAFIQRLQQGQLKVSKEKVKALRVDNVVVIHHGVDFYRNLMPARTHVWDFAGSNTDHAVISVEELREIIYADA